MAGVHPFGIGKSPIHGRGAFATRPIERGELVGVAILRKGDDLRQTVLSRYLNHSDKPNATMVPILGGFGLQALRAIQKGEELLVDYETTGRIVLAESKTFPPYESFDPTVLNADPRVRGTGRVGDFSIVEVDGPTVRRLLDADFTNFGHHYTFRFIPRDELWIDREAHPDDAPFYIHHMLIERRLMASGTQRDKALEIADRAERAERAKAMERMETKGAPPERIKLKPLGKLSSGKRIWLVSGKAVRDMLFVDFTEGGHWLAYGFIPEGEIWIEDDVQPRERALVLLHELFEAERMAKGLSYEKAHAEALGAEWRARRSLPDRPPISRRAALTMPFPRRYRKRLEEGGKSVTHRIGDEQGRYREGEVRRAMSYDGEDWGFEVEIADVATMPVSDLPARIRGMADFRNLPDDAKVDVIGLGRPSMAKDHAYVGKRKEDSGNVTYLYDERHIAARNRKKEKRLRKLSKSLKEMRAKVKSDLSSDSEEKRLAALAVALIDETYERVGNEESASDLKHYGVTGWLLKHVTLGKDKATIKYVGKAGVKQSKEVKNKTVLRALRRACEGKDKGDRVLEGIGAKDVNTYLAPFGITAKDIRGYHANKEMLRSLKENGKPPKGDDKAIKERFKKALADAAKKVGHDPGTLKRQYLIPRIEQYYMEGRSVKSILASQVVPISKRAGTVETTYAGMVVVKLQNAWSMVQAYLNHPFVQSSPTRMVAVPAAVAAGGLYKLSTYLAKKIQGVLGYARSLAKELRELDDAVVKTSRLFNDKQLDKDLWEWRRGFRASFPSFAGIGQMASDDSGLPKAIVGLYETCDWLDKEWSIPIFSKLPREYDPYRSGKGPFSKWPLRDIRPIIHDVTKALPPPDVVRKNLYTKEGFETRMEDIQKSRKKLDEMLKEAGMRIPQVTEQVSRLLSVPPLASRAAADGQFLLFVGGFPVAWFPTEAEAEAGKTELVDGFPRGESIVWDLVRMESRSPFALVSMVDPTATMPNFDALVEYLRADPKHQSFLRRYAEAVVSVHPSPDPIDSDRIPPARMATDLYELAGDLPSPDMPGFDWDALAKASDEMNSLVESLAEKVAKASAGLPISKRAAVEKDLRTLFPLSLFGGMKRPEMQWNVWTYSWSQVTMHLMAQNPGEYGYGNEELAVFHVSKRPPMKAGDKFTDYQVSIRWRADLDVPLQWEERKGRYKVFEGSFEFDELERNMALFADVIASLTLGVEKLQEQETSSGFARLFPLHLFNGWQLHAYGPKAISALLLFWVDNRQWPPKRPLSPADLRKLHRQVGLEEWEFEARIGWEGLPEAMLLRKRRDTGKKVIKFWVGHTGFDDPKFDKMAKLIAALGERGLRSEMLPEKTAGVPFSKRVAELRHPREDEGGNCFFHAAIMALKRPELTLVKGRHSRQHPEDTAHFWLEDEDGNIVDPTAGRYPPGEYTKEREVSARDNLDALVRNPLFTTLPKADRELIRSLLRRRPEGHLLESAHELPLSRRAAETEDLRRLFPAATFGGMASPETPWHIAWYKPNQIRADGPAGTMVDISRELSEEGGFRATIRWLTVIKVPKRGLLAAAEPFGHKLRSGHGFQEYQGFFSYAELERMRSAIIDAVMLLTLAIERSSEEIGKAEPSSEGLPTTLSEMFPKSLFQGWHVSGYAPGDISASCYFPGLGNWHFRAAHWTLDSPIVEVDIGLYPDYTGSRARHQTRLTRKPDDPAFGRIRDLIEAIGRRKLSPVSASETPPLSRRAASSFEPLTPQDVDELARQMAQYAIESWADNIVQTVGEERKTGLDSFGANTLMWDGGSVLRIADDISWDMISTKLNQRAALRQLLLDLIDQVRRRVFRAPYPLETGLEGALRLHEARHGHAKLNRELQRENTKDWHGFVAKFGKSILDKLVEESRNPETVVFAAMPHNIDGIQDMLGDEEPYGWDGAHLKYIRLKEAAKTSDEAQDMLEKALDESRQKAKALVPTLVREQYRSAAILLPLSKHAATIEEEELTYLYQLTAEALKEVGGYEALEHDWQRGLFDDMADALWHKDLPHANRVIDRILKYVVGSARPPLSKRAAETEDLRTVFPLSMFGGMKSPHMQWNVQFYGPNHIEMVFPAQVPRDPNTGPPGPVGDREDLARLLVMKDGKNYHIGMVWKPELDVPLRWEETGSGWKRFESRMSFETLKHNADMFADAIASLTLGAEKWEEKEKPPELVRLLPRHLLNGWRIVTYGPKWITAFTYTVRKTPQYTSQLTWDLRARRDENGIMATLIASYTYGGGIISKFHVENRASDDPRLARMLRLVGEVGERALKIKMASLPRHLYHYAPPEARDDIAESGLKTPRALPRADQEALLERYRERTAETLGKPKEKITVGDMLKGLEKRREAMFDGPGGSKALSAFLDPIPDIEGMHAELRKFADNNDLYRIDYAAALRDGVVEKAAIVEEKPRSERPVEPEKLVRELEGSPITGAQWRTKGKFHFSGKAHAMIALKDGTMPAKYLELVRQAWDDRPPLARRAKPAARMDGKTPGAPPG